MKFVKRLNKMYIVAEIPRLNPKTKKYEYHGDLSVIPDTSNPHYNPMWEWDRFDIYDWYNCHGHHYDTYISNKKK